MWLSALGTVPQTERVSVQFPVRALAWAVSQVPIWWPARGNQLMFFSHIDVFLLLFLPFSPSMKVHK